MPEAHARRSRCVMVLVMLAPNLTLSCALFAGDVPVARASGRPTPTPFQPATGIVHSPFSVAALPGAEATFTPYPTAFIPPRVLPTAVGMILPASGTSGEPQGTFNNPLTGLRPENPALLDRRPMVVKITNYERYVRPQSGLTLADVVFEYYIEAKLTRFIAVMYGNDSPKVGPVRSGRYFDEHLARMYRAYYIFKYADPREYKYYKESDLLDFLVVPGAGACPPFVVGGGGRDIYNNIFFNTTKFASCLARAGLDNSRQPLRSNFFSDRPIGGEMPATRVFTRYSTDDYNYWDFDAQSGRYMRFQEAADTRGGKPETYAPLEDAETGRPVTAENVIVLFVRHTFTNSFDQEDEIYHIDLVDSGEAFVFRDGLAIPARWYRTDLDQPLLIATAMGAPVYLRPGVTFYQVIGESSVYSNNAEEWHFQFMTP